MSTPERPEQVVVVKSWTAFLVLIGWLVITVMGYTRLESQGAENERRIFDLEQRHTVTLDQYQDGQRSIEQRLDRIERKIDAQDGRKR